MIYRSCHFGYCRNFISRDWGHRCSYTPNFLFYLEVATLWTVNELVRSFSKFWHIFKMLCNILMCFNIHTRGGNFNPFMYERVDSISFGFIENKTLFCISISVHWFLQNKIKKRTSVFVGQTDADRATWTCTIRWPIPNPLKYTISICISYETISVGTQSEFGLSSVFKCRFAHPYLAYMMFVPCSLAGMLIPRIFLNFFPLSQARYHLKSSREVCFLIFYILFQYIKQRETMSHSIIYNIKSIIYISLITICLPFALEMKDLR